VTASGGSGHGSPRWAVWAWVAQPAYLVVEVGAALATGVLYTLRDDTISALGTTCTYPAAVAASASTVGAGEGCSTAPWVMNVAFVVFGLLQALGATELVRRGGRHSLVGSLWLVAGLASVGVGLLPVDEHPTAHALVALPVFVAQPLALLLHPRLVTGTAVRVVGWALAAVSVTGAGVFTALLGQWEWVGAAERAAIWPAKLWLPLAALAPVLGPLLPRRRTPAARARPPGPRRDDTSPGTRPTG
jgi:hypothetical membrane protein